MQLSTSLHVVICATELVSKVFTLDFYQRLLGIQCQRVQNELFINSNKDNTTMYQSRCIQIVALVSESSRATGGTREETIRKAALMKHPKAGWVGEL